MSSRLRTLPEGLLHPEQADAAGCALGSGQWAVGSESGVGSVPRQSAPSQPVGAQPRRPQRPLL